MAWRRNDYRFGVGSGVEEQIEYLLVVPVGRPMQGSRPIRLRCVDVTSLLQQRAERLFIVLLGGVRGVQPGD